MPLVELGPGVAVFMYGILVNQSGRVYTVRSVALVDADNLVLVAAFTKPLGPSRVLNNAPYPFGDPRICPDQLEFASGDDRREAFALLRPLGDESVVPPTDGKPSEDGKDVELDVALRLVDSSREGVFRLARVVVRDEETGDFWSVPLQTTFDVAPSDCGAAS